MDYPVAVVPTHMGEYLTLLFTWPPNDVFGEGQRQSGVFTGYCKGRDEYVTYMVRDTFVPGGSEEVNEDRWTGEEGLRTNSITHATGHHERYVRRIMNNIVGFG
jgi:hypothetical protein